MGVAKRVRDMNAGGLRPDPSLGARPALNHADGPFGKMSAADAARLARERFGEGAWVRGRHHAGTLYVCVIFGPDNKVIALGDTFEEAFAAAPTRADSPPAEPDYECFDCGTIIRKGVCPHCEAASPPIPPSEPRVSGAALYMLEETVRDGGRWENRADRRAVSDNDILDVIADLRDARAALARTIGIGPGENAGSPADCTDCGRAMVWNRKPGEQGPGSSWMCPRCVLERCLKAEAALAARSGEGAK